MPLPEELRKGLDSARRRPGQRPRDRSGGMLVGGLFLREFVPDGVAAGRTWTSPARPSTREAPFGYTPKGGTGAAVRALVAIAARRRRPTTGRVSSRGDMMGQSVAEEESTVARGRPLRHRRARRRQRRVRLRAARGRARQARGPDREGQGRRDLPAPRLHPDQGAAARGRGRRPRRESEKFGIRTSFEGIDMPAVLSYQHGVVDRLWKGLQSTIASRKIDTIIGDGRLVSPTSVAVGDDDLHRRPHRAGHRVACRAVAARPGDRRRPGDHLRRRADGSTGCPSRRSSSAAA